MVYLSCRHFGLRLILRLPSQPECAPRNASGAALGVVGIASYIGAGLQDVMSGVLIEGNKQVVNGVEVYDFTYINWFWIGAALLSVLLALLVWNAKGETIK